MLLGIDISTSITGWCILDSEGQIIKTGAVDMRNKNKFPDFWAKCDAVEGLFIDLKIRYEDISSIWIEQTLQTFKSGFSSAQVLSMLSRFNGIVSFCAYKIFHIKPEYIGARSARAVNGIKIPRGQKPKPVVAQFLLDTEPMFVVEYTKHGNLKPQYYDIADAIIIAKAGYKKCQI